jgi:aspartyl-tRNA(Asn)/glutamyl-tRNA(Gln) amidotransferase subunit C
MMMESLPREKVLHVADLGRIKIDEEEIEKFGCGLKQIWDEIEKVNNLNIDTDDILITPTDNANVYRNDEPSEMVSIQDALKNAPQTKENYIETVRVIND